MATDALDFGGASPPAASRGRPRRGDRRLRRMFDAYFDFIARSLRGLGVPEGDVDDAAQQVFLVASRRLDDIREGAERAFLFSTALNVAQRAHRTRQRRREVAEDPEEPDPNPTPEALADQRRARAILDTILEELPMDLRAVFVLFEIEELSMPEIATTLDIPVGTVASRLRRARADFQQRVKRLQARSKRGANP